MNQLTNKQNVINKCGKNTSKDNDNKETQTNEGLHAKAKH